MKRSNPIRFGAVCWVLLLSACGPAKTPEQEAAEYEEAVRALSGAMQAERQMFNAVSKISHASAASAVDASAAASRAQ